MVAVSITTEEQRMPQHRPESCHASGDASHTSVTGASKSRRDEEQLAISRAGRLEPTPRRSGQMIGGHAAPE